MENRLDQLFRNKLLGQEIKPSSDAWEQVHSKLSTNRRTIWVKRLAIAASILIIFTAGFYGYRTTIHLDVITENNVGKAVSDEENINNQQAQNENAQLANENEKTEEVIIKEEQSSNRELAQKVQQLELGRKITKKQLTNETKKEDQQPIVETESNVDNGQNSTIVENEKNEIPLQESPNLQEKTKSDESFVAENTASETKDTAPISEEMPVKKYSEVKIIYKANNDSKLVASGKQSILNKGINKITEFSDEHLLTADRKEKLRNTKEDLLALNFGKLLNRSNKESEN